MANKTVKAVADKKVAEKKVVEKFDYKALAEKIEADFKTDKTVDVVADTNRDYPRSMTENDYRYIHFYNPGTEKNMFGLYIKKDKALFAVSTKVGAYLDKSLTVTPNVKKIKGEEKTTFLIVSCDYAGITDTAKKIIAAYAQKPAKAEKKVVDKKVEKKPAEKKTTTKKVANK